MSDIDHQTENAIQEAKGQLASLSENLDQKIQETEDIIHSRKRKRTHDDAITDAEFDLANRKEKKMKLEGDRNSFIARYTRAKVKRWKEALFSQKGKGQGKYKIDRRSEQHVYDALQEHLAAHDRRHGTPETGYFANSRFTKSKLRRIANNWLQQNGMPIIKSLETVRSWGKPRSISSIQARQHRGRNLWCRMRPQKKKTIDHVNIHYNRAHIKNIRRMIYGTGSNLAVCFQIFIIHFFAK